MDARAIIQAVRDGVQLAESELRWFANGLASGAVSDAQAGAFAMAVVLRGLPEGGRTALTAAMRDSGHRLSWDLSGPVVDKHSTGGVGDCVSIVLAPALAACGAFVPMISGRGLGHTGGTLDKLEAIPNVKTSMDIDKLREIVTRQGCVIAGATADIAPADRRLYAVRDVTGTVESIDLICASILSKKLAAGLDALVLDVKCGSGAFMQSLDQAEELACALATTGNSAGCKTEAIISDMSQPLAPSLGNALEIADCMRVLEGDRGAAPRLRELVVTLGAIALRLVGLAGDEAEAKIGRAIDTGDAMDRFQGMLSAMGGSNDFSQNWRTQLPTANLIMDVTADAPGHLAAIDGRALGEVVVALGAGRKTEADRIDHSVGLSDFAALGARFSTGDLICRVHARSQEEAERAVEGVLAACEIGPKPSLNSLIRTRSE